MQFAKIVTAVVLMVAGAAHAGGYTTIEYSDETKRSDDTSKQKLGVVVGNKTAAGTDYSFKVETSQSDWGTGSVSSGAEVRVKQSFGQVFGVTPYVGVRLGQKIATNESFGHYAVDAGVKFPIMGNFSGDVGYRYRNAFDTVNAFNSNRGHVIVAYAVTKTDSVAIRYSQAYGDVGEEKNAYRLSYTHSF